MGVIDKFVAIYQKTAEMNKIVANVYFLNVSNFFYLKILYKQYVISFI